MTRQEGSTRWTPESARSVQAFLRTEAGSSALLLAATVIALVWANSPANGAYEDLWSTKLSFELGGERISEDLRHWVNDGLMVIFFYVIGLEIRRELALGELRDRAKAAVPAAAALAGMAVPALVYILIAPGGEAARGWGVVMATDIAFVLGALALLGDRVPPSLRTFLLTLAIIDDVGAITVIAFFYSDSIDLAWLAAAGAILVGILLLRALRVWRGPGYFVFGLALWFAMYESGVHPTIAGVLLGLVTAVHAPTRPAVERAATLARSFRQAPTPGLARSAVLGVNAAVSPNERLQESLHPWTSYVIVPLFALANAGVVLTDGALGDALGSRVVLAILAGLVLGKTIGIALSSLGALRFPAAALPAGMGRRHLAGAGALAGIGFTVSLFVVDLAFEDPVLRDEAKVGVLLASLVAAVAGLSLLRAASRHATPVGGARPTRLEPSVERRHDHVRGPFGAPLTLVEYADFECPFCGTATGVVAELRERFGDDLRYVFRHLPNRDRHPQAQHVAEAVEAAGAQGMFWEMHDRVFSHQERLELDDLLGDAQALGLDVERFAEDLRDGVHASAIESDVVSAQESGVEATPTFFVGDLRHTGPGDAQSLATALRAAASDG